MPDDQKRPEPNRSTPGNEADDLFIVELDERLEFGAAIIDSDLDGADDNAGCSNSGPCNSSDNLGCSNSGC
jgi:hypothetical protein